MSLVTKHIYYAKTGDDLVREQKWNESERSQQLGRAEGWCGERFIVDLISHRLK